MNISQVENVKVETGSNGGDVLCNNIYWKKSITNNTDSHQSDDKIEKQSIKLEAPNVKIT